jgi:hypothetical protein
MKSLRHIVCSSLIVLSLSACAAPHTVGPQASQSAIAREAAIQREMMITREIEAQAKLLSVSHPIMLANAEFCGKKVKPVVGMVMWNKDSLSPEVARAVESAYGLSNRLTIQMTADSSAAADAGLKGGDIIVALNGQNIAEGKAGLRQSQQIISAAGESPITVIYERNGQARETVLKPKIACAYPVILDDSAEINAYADGQKIVVARGLMKFVENNNELALVIAHELAHNTMGHINKKQQNVLAGSLGGLAVDAVLGAAGVGTGGQFSKLGGQMGMASHSVAFEQEADYIGMYYMERAGYSSAGVAQFWRRMAAEGNSSVNMRTTHPSSPERFLAIEAVHQEIQAKRRSGQALIPNLNRS